MAKAPKTAVVSLRISAEIKAKLDQAAQWGPYRLSMSDIVERGIVLALAELAASPAPGTPKNA